MFVLRYLADAELRRRIGRQLNKGETLHSLLRQLFFAPTRATFATATREDQTEQALCLTIVTNAVVASWVQRRGQDDDGGVDRRPAAAR